GSLHEVRSIYDQINCIDESPFFSAEIVSHNAKLIWGKFESLAQVDWNGVRHVHSDFVHKRIERAKRRDAASYYSAKERFDAAKDRLTHPYFVWMFKTTMKELFGSAQGWSFAREQEDRQGK